MEDKTKEELDTIIKAINDSTLPEHVKDFIVKCIDAALWFPHILQKKDISLKRLKSMIFGKGYSSSQQDDMSKYTLLLMSELQDDKGPRQSVVYIKLENHIIYYKLIAKDNSIQEGSITKEDSDLGSFSMPKQINLDDQKFKISLTKLIVKRTNSIVAKKEKQAQQQIIDQNALQNLDLSTASTQDIENSIVVEEHTNTANSNKIPGHGRMAHTVYTKYQEFLLKIEDIKPGDPCPLEKCTGKLYIFEPRCPKVLVRIVGQEMAEVRKYVVERMRCNLCSYIVQAQIPKEIGSEKYDATFKAMLILQKYYVAIPFYRQEIFQKLLGFTIPDSTQWDLVEKAAGCCYPIFNELIRLSANGELIHNDDTRLKIQSVIKELKQDPDKKRKGMFTSGFVAINKDKKIALFLNGSKHAGENLSAILAKRDLNQAPIIQMCDALSANIAKDDLGEDIQTILCNCLSHGFRKFNEVLQSFPQACITIMRLLSVAYKNDIITKDMSRLERLKYHQEHTRATMETLARYMSALFAEKLVEPNSELGKSIKYMQNNWDKLTRFLSVAGAPLCNNIVERSLKVAIRSRKASMFYRSPYSAHIGGMLTSIIYTCELNQINPYEYLVAVQNNASSVLDNPQHWLPWNYQADFTDPPLAACANH